MYMELEPPGAEDQAMENGHERPKRHQHRGHLEVDKAMTLLLIVHLFFILFMFCVTLSALFFLQSQSNVTFSTPIFK